MAIYQSYVQWPFFGNCTLAVSDNIILCKFILNVNLLKLLLVLALDRVVIAFECWYFVSGRGMKQSLASSSNKQSQIYENWLFGTVVMETIIIVSCAFVV